MSTTFQGMCFNCGRQGHMARHCWRDHNPRTQRPTHTQTTRGTQDTQGVGATSPLQGNGHPPRVSQLVELTQPGSTLFEKEISLVGKTPVTRVKMGDVSVVSLLDSGS